jgi:hypothetical protein
MVMRRSYLVAMVFLTSLTIIASGGAIFLIVNEPTGSKSLALNQREMGPGWYTYYQLERDDHYPEFQWYLETELRKDASDQLFLDPYGWNWGGMFLHIEIGLADSSGSSQQTLEGRVPNTELVTPSEIGDGGWYIYRDHREGGFFCGFTVGCYYVYIGLNYGVISVIPSLDECLHIAQMQAEKLT